MMMMMMMQHTWKNLFVSTVDRASNRKIQKMPNQACANGLKLDDIPQDLQQLLTLERQLISFRLPFITIIIMRSYGGHFKVSGPPVNVPTTLDQVINMLPRMPNQLQLYPIKLKRKLEYKSHYMYDVICNCCTHMA